MLSSARSRRALGRSDTGAAVAMRQNYRGRGRFAKRTIEHEYMRIRDGGGAMNDLKRGRGEPYILCRERFNARAAPGMKFQQLRYLVAVHENGLNITAAARQLHTSQPGVSRQLKLLEEELGFQLFEREGRALTRTTDAGEEIISRASAILREMQNIRRTSAELRKADGGTLSIATTHTQARYVLPEVIRAFRIKYPKVRLHLHQGTSEQIAEMVARDRVDFAIATGSEEQFPHLVRLPVYRWHRAVVVPRGHPLASAGKLTLKKLAEYPIVTYVFSISGRSSVWGSGSWRVWRSIRQLTRIWSCSMRRIYSKVTRRGSDSGAAPCCAPTCMSSSNCWRRTCRASWCARPRNWRPRKMSIESSIICKFRSATCPSGICR
jgi:DNA-binding transcriptional LysR family regulator